MPIGRTPLLTLLQIALLGAWDAVERCFRYESSEKVIVKPSAGNPGYGANDDAHQNLLLRTMIIAMAGAPEDRRFLLKKTQLAIRGQSIVQGFALRTMDMPTDISLALCVALELLDSKQMSDISKRFAAWPCTDAEVIYSIVAKATTLTPTATPYWFGVSASDLPSAHVPAFYESGRPHGPLCITADERLPPALAIPPSPPMTANKPIVWYFDHKCHITSSPDDLNGDPDLYFSGMAMTSTYTRRFLQASSFSSHDAENTRLLLVGMWEPRLLRENFERVPLEYWCDDSTKFESIRTLLIREEGKDRDARWRQLCWFSHSQAWWKSNRYNFRTSEKFRMVKPLRNLGRPQDEPPWQEARESKSSKVGFMHGPSTGQHSRSTASTGTAASRTNDVDV